MIPSWSGSNLSKHDRHFSILRPAWAEADGYLSMDPSGFLPLKPAPFLRSRLMSQQHPPTAMPLMLSYLIMSRGRVAFSNGGGHGYGDEQEHGDHHLEA